MKRMLLSLAGAGLLGTLAVYTLRLPAAEATPRAATEMKRAEVDSVTLHVEGMTCGGCAISTRVVLERLPGVKEATVRYEEKSAVVTYDPDRVSVQQMIAAVKTLGYTATVVPAGTP
jgi:copper chaperone